MGQSVKIVLARFDSHSQSPTKFMCTPLAITENLELNYLHTLKLFIKCFLQTLLSMFWIVSPPCLELHALLEDKQRIKSGGFDHSLFLSPFWILKLQITSSLHTNHYHISTKYCQIHSLLHFNSFLQDWCAKASFSFFIHAIFTSSWKFLEPYKWMQFKFISSN